MARHTYGAIAERSRTQLGLIIREQLRQLGVSRHQEQHLVDTGILQRVEPRVLCVAGVPPSWEQLLLAGVLGLGPGAVVSHMAAAAIWGLDGVPPGAVELTVPRGCRNRLGVGTVHSSLHLEPIDVGRRGRFPITRPTRTIIDIAGALPIRRLEGVVDAACRERLTDEHALVRRSEELRRAGTRKLLRVLGADRATGRPHTWLERETLAIFRRGGGPVPRMQAELARDGRVVRVDGIFDEAALIIEVAGHRTHSTRRQRQADAERRLCLEQSGFRVLEFTYEDVTERPDYVLATVLARLAVRH
jgi:hypothetical protein